MRVYRPICGFIAAFALIGCQISSDTNYDPGSGSQSGDQGQGQNTGFGNGTDPTPVGGDEEPVEYPYVEYTAYGNLASINNNPIMMDTNYQLDTAKVNIAVTRFRSKDSTIDKNVKNKTGHTEVERLTKDEMAEWVKENSFNNLGFIMYAKSSQVYNKDNQPTTNQTFSQPLPVVVVPTQMSRFDVLKAGPVTYNNIEVTNTKDQSKMIVHIKIEEVSREGDIETIKITTDIPKDDQGRAYDRFILPREATYTIDTKEKRIPKYHIMNYYYNSEKGRKTYTLDHEICKVETKEKKLEFPCKRR